MSGPLIFLDTRDIINCVEKHNPCGAPRLASELGRAGVAIVLTFTNLLESIPRKRGLRYALEFVRRLETIPHVFVQHTAIGQFEFEEAVTAFGEDRKPDHSLERFPTWAQYLCTFAPQPPPPDDLARLDQIPLWRHMEGLLTDGEGIEFDPQFVEMIAGTVAQNRQVLGTKRAGKAELLELAEDQLNQCGLSVSDPRRFAKWLYADPSICPGWRLLQETTQELRCDTGAAVEKGDLADMTHLYLISYMRAATMDRKWREYIGRAARKLCNAGSAVSYPVFENLGAMRAARFSAG